MNQVSVWKLLLLNNKNKMNAAEWKTFLLNVYNLQNGGLQSVTILNSTLVGKEDINFP